jgi:hypothetical protein
MGKIVVNEQSGYSYPIPKAGIASSPRFAATGFCGRGARAVHTKSGRDENIV